MKLPDDSVLMPIHGGAGEALRRRGEPLDCNAFCQDGVHCDIFWLTTQASEQEAMVLAIANWPGEVLRIEPGGPEARKPQWNDQYGWGDPEGEMRPWLVFWRAK